MTFIHSGEYTFYIVEEPEYDYDDDLNKIETESVNIEALSLKKQPYPCVKITISKNKKHTIGELHLVNYYKSCSVREKELEQHTGTIIMIQTVLTYTLNKYPHITSVELQDETFIHVPSKPLITSRRLLLGQKGWYEEYLGALPKDERLIYKLHFLRHPSTQEKVSHLLPPEAKNKLWWIPEHIANIADKLHKDLFMYLIGTQWTISKETIMGYGITMRQSPVSASQSGGFKKKLMRISQGAALSHVSHHRVRRD